MAIHDMDNMDESDTHIPPLDELVRAVDGQMPADLVRQPDEPLAAYLQFLRYLALGPGRGYTKLARELGHHVRSVERLSVRYHWFSRAQVWDSVVAKLMLQRTLRESVLRQQATANTVADGLEYKQTR